MTEEILISLNNKKLGNKIIHKCIDNVLHKFTASISLNTKLGYHLYVENSIIHIPFEININEINESKSQLRKHKLQELIEYLENYDFSNWSIREKYCLNILYLAFQDENILKVEFENIKKNIKFKNFMKYKIRIEEKIQEDKTKIRQIINPLSSDFGIFIDHSKPFELFTLDYNILHLFEHLAVPWKDKSEYIYQNGFTNVVGNCYCCLITSTKETCIKGLNEYIDWHNKFRKSIHSFDEKIKLEIIRTHYESLEFANIQSFGKPFSGIYDNDYHYDILSYFASLSFKILIITPEFIPWEKIHNLRKSEKIEKPNPTKLEQIPLTYFLNKEIDNYVILPIKEKEKMDKKITQNYSNKIFKPITEQGNYIEGVDCILVPLNDYPVKDCNILLKDLFDKSKIELEKSFENITLPLTNIGLMELDREFKKEGVFMVGI